MSGIASHRIVYCSAWLRRLKICLQLTAVIRSATRPHLSQRAACGPYSPSAVTDRMQQTLLLLSLIVVAVSLYASFINSSDVSRPRLDEHGTAPVSFPISEMSATRHTHMYHTTSTNHIWDVCIHSTGAARKGLGNLNISSWRWTVKHKNVLRHFILWHPWRLLCRSYYMTDYIISHSNIVISYVRFTFLGENRQNHDSDENWQFQQQILVLLMSHEIGTHI